MSRTLWVPSGACSCAACGNVVYGPCEQYEYVDSDAVGEERLTIKVCFQCRTFCTSNKTIANLLNPVDSLTS
jgi:hypothetical protein